MVQGKRTNILVPSHTPSPVGFHVVKCNNKVRDKNAGVVSGFPSPAHASTIPQSFLCRPCLVLPSCLSPPPPAPFPFSTACYCDWCLVVQKPTAKGVYFSTPKFCSTLIFGKTYMQLHYRKSILKNKYKQKLRTLNKSLRSNNRAQNVTPLLLLVTCLSHEECPKPRDHVRLTLPRISMGFLRARNILFPS